MTRVLGQIDDATAHSLVLHFGLKGAIDYATKIFQMGGPLAKEYGWLADYLTADRRMSGFYARADYEWMPDVDGEYVRETVTWQRWVEEAEAGRILTRAENGDV